MNIIETNLEFNSNYITRPLSAIKRIILHNSGTTVLQSVETIHNYHKNSRGYAGIGYNFYVRKDGTIYKGRPIEWVPAHAYGSNYDSIGICFEGNFNEEEMGEAQKEAGKWLVAYLNNKYNISIVQAHRDVCATSCPGDKFPFDEIANSNESNEIIPVEKENVSEGNVANIQATLNERYGVNIVVDNIYGNKTRKALVKGLQTELNKQYNRGLAVDEIFGTNTYNACINVRKGAEGNITWLIQAMLVCHGFNIEIDKIFGNNTENAVKEFQRRNGLSVDGICRKKYF